MSEYKRFVAYVHQLEPERIQTPVGFVRVYAKNKEWNFIVHIEADAFNEGFEIPIYLCVEGESCTWGILLEHARSMQGTLRWEGSVKERDWEEKPYRLQDVCGLRLELPDGAFYGATWDGEGQKLDCFRVYEKQDVEEERERPGLEAQAIEEPGRQKKWDYLAERFPVQSLFGESGTPMDCIRMNVGDLSRIPRSDWILGNNSFLLHGYYQHRHLLLCRQEEGNGTNYYLGVPGYLNEQEQMMAALFGFLDFKRSGNCGIGYWFRKIEEIKNV